MKPKSLNPVLITVQILERIRKCSSPLEPWMLGQCNTFINCGTGLSILMPNISVSPHLPLPFLSGGSTDQYEMPKTAISLIIYDMGVVFSLKKPWFSDIPRCEDISISF